MKNWLNKFKIPLAAILLVVTATFVGCDLNQAQMKAIANNAGLGATVAWIAKQNPDAETKELVSGALNVIQSNLTVIAEGKTYSEVMYPVVNEYVKSDKVPAQYRPAILAGVQLALNGIDTMFIMYPEWKNKEELTLSIVNSFIIGAETGLALSDSDPKVVQARRIYEVNAKVWTP